MAEYLKLDDLEIYQTARDLSKQAWGIYLKLKVDEKIMMGQQFVRSVDSISANIAEGYGRFHFLDKIKFYHTARASLLESMNWLGIISEREIITQEQYNLFNSNAIVLHARLNAFIKYNLNKKSTIS